mgnify:CR=1 FL=1
MSELTLVTSYFDIGRSDWAGFNRGDEQYLSHFKHWARMRNYLIVYTMPTMVEKVLEIRRLFGLENKTAVIPIPDVNLIDPDLYQTFQYVMSNKDSWRFHKRLANPESWNPHYNYIMALKSYWVQDAIARGLTTGMAAWIDFGYDHGGQDFPYAEDWDFSWKYEFTPHIHVFLKNDLDETPIFRIVQNMKVYMCGAPIIAPDMLWTKFWKEIRKSAFTLTECGLADDDQTLMLMVYRAHPEWFQTHKITYWGQALHDYGGEALRVRPHKKKKAPWLHTLGYKLKADLRDKYTEWDIRRRKGTDIEKKYFQ